MEEARSLVRRYSNVYVDTSAIPGFIVKLMAKSIPADRILFGTDYPVIDVEDVRGLIEMQWRALKSTGLRLSELRSVFGELAEELFGVRCINSGGAR